jgi:membrane-bound lytic murein transglycosylase B
VDESVGRSTGADSPPATADHLATWQSVISAASARFGIPEDWIRAVILAESGGHPVIDGRPAMSPAGAMGLMQVMPKTYAEMRAKFALGSDPYNATDNIMAGSGYLAELYRQLGFPGLFAAYNAGPQRYREHLDLGNPLPEETIFYLKTVTTVLSADTKSTADFVEERGQLVTSQAAKSTLFFGTGRGQLDAGDVSIFIHLGPDDSSQQ